METIRQLVGILGALVTLVHAPEGDDREIGSCSIVDAQDAEQLATTIDRQTEVVILLGTDKKMTRQVLGRIAATGPALILIKSTADRSDFFTGIPVAVAVVDGEVGWGQLHSIVDRVIVDGRVREQGREGGAPIVGSHSDLFGLANTLADMMGGLVSIDDPMSRVLAFSPLDDSADELRRQCIMGRSAPPGHIEELNKQGTFGQLRRSAEAFMLPGTPTVKPRLCVGLHDESTREYLGTIWVQQGEKPFKPRARQILQAGGLVASRLIDGSRRMPSHESEMLRELLDMRPSELSPEQLVGALKLQAKKDWTIVGFSAPPSPSSRFDYPVASSTLGTLSLEAATLRSTARATYEGSALFVVFPDCPALDSVHHWALQVTKMLSRTMKQTVRAAIGPAVQNSSGLGDSRRLIHEVLATAHAKESSSVVSHTDFETSLTLTRLMGALSAQNLISPSRIGTLLDLPHSNGATLMATLLCFFDLGGDFGSSARILNIHPNTMRKRLRRIETITGLSVSDPEERLLLELEARIFRLKSRLVQSHSLAGERS